MYGSGVTQGPLSVLNAMVLSVSGILLNICAACGVAFIAAAFYQWNERRGNPSLGMSQPITFLFLGIFLILVQYIPMSTLGV